MRKLIILVFVFSSCLTTVNAQQDPQFSHNMFNQLAFNPAYAGTQNMLDVMALHRQQWVGFGDGTPTTTLLSAHAKVSPLGIKSGVGLTVIDDRIGFEKNLNFKGAYSYHLNAFGGTMAFGIEIGASSKSLDGSSWIWNEAGDPNIPDSETDMAFDLGLGIFYYTPKMYIGIASTHLNEADFETATSNIPYQKRHYYFTGGYNIKLPNPLFEICPSTFVKYDGASMQFSFNTNIVYNRKFWGGISYRYEDSFVALLGLEVFNNLRIGYAYDITTSDISNYSNGSHELMVSYSLNLVKMRPARKYRSVRFL